MLYVLTGVRGAGKTTLIENIRRDGVGLVLQPSTTRPPRFEGEAEYDFVKTWDFEKYAWSIKVGDHNYGMRLSEVQKAATAPAFTVFEPIAIETFYDYRKRSGLLARTIGLNTVPNLAEQHARVGGDLLRVMTDEQFDAASKRVLETDHVIDGNEDDVLAKVVALARDGK